MVIEVEVAGKAGAGEVGLVPAPVVPLRRGEPRNRSVERLSAGACGLEREQRPRGLRRGRYAPRAPLPRAVGAQVLAEPAVLVLDALEPRDGAPYALVLGEPGGGERRHDGADAVDVVRAPAPEPRPVRLLRAQQPVDPLTGRDLLVRKQLDHVRGH